MGYKYTLEVISDLIKDKKTHVITMADQEHTYQNVKKELGMEIWLFHSPVM